MNPVMFPPPNPGYQGVGVTQITRRMLTDAERQLAVGYYKKLQTGLRGLAIICLILFIANGYVLSAIVDPVIYDSMTIVVTVFMLVLGLVSVGMSVNTLSIRKKVTDSMRDGSAVEVSGPAYMSRAVKNVPSWTVGPVSLVASREVMGLLQEGAQVSILCLPRLKIAIAVNNYGLKHGVRIMIPPNLEAMAVPSYQAPPMPMGQPYESLNASYQPPMPQK